MEKINYKLEKYEGSLDLLLHLIEKNKIDIFDIPIALITEQYLDYVSKMQEANMDISSDFLVMASTLLEIKSRMLLPLVKNDADNVLLGIKEFVYTIGVPNILQTDNGSEFVNNKVKNFCEKNKILFIQSRPRNPKCNGIIEVSHKEIRKYVLTKFAIQEENKEELF